MTMDSDPSLERCADPLDEAAAITAKSQDAAVAAIRKLTEPEHHPDFDGKHCLDCDDEIPVGRLNLGRIRCVYCQEAKAKREKLLGQAPSSNLWG